MANSSHFRRTGGRALGATLALGVLGLGLGSGAALAQTPAAPAAATAAASPNVPPRPIGVARISGTVSTKTDSGFVLAGESGPINVRLTPETRIFGVAPGSANDIKSGAYIGAGARPQADGTLSAVQVYVFPEAQRGLAEGHRAWDALPDSTMTNATVASEGGAVDGDVLTLTYPGGSQKLRIGKDSAILVAAPAGADDLRPGTPVAVSGVPGPQGLSAQRITIGTKGAKPL